MYIVYEFFRDENDFIELFVDGFINSGNCNFIVVFVLNFEVRVVEVVKKEVVEKVVVEKKEGVEKKVVYEKKEGGEKEVVVDEVVVDKIKDFGV